MSERYGEGATRVEPAAKTLSSPRPRSPSGKVKIDPFRR
jgi:hypothetical protein